MDYARQQRDPTRHMLGISVVILVHALVVWALLSGLGSNVIQIIKKPLNATIIEEVKLPPPPPPPPPPPKKIVEPPKVQPAVETYVPPPDIPVAAPTTAPVISAVTQAPPTAPHVIAAPPVVQAPPAPVAKPAVRRGVVRLSGDAPSYPREAIRAGVSKGRVVARLQIDEKGN
ncbi:MAG: energy transducer TonB, partial [Betaproteobacteria bacterium]